MDTTVTTSVIPSPVLKKSIKPKLPGRAINVFVPEPTGVKKGDNAATQIATAIAVGLIPKLIAIGITKGVLGINEDSLIEVISLQIGQNESSKYLLGVLNE